MESILAYEYQPAAHLLVRDEDAGDFLQSQFTNELRPVEAGRCAYGLWLDVKGKVVADGWVLCEGAESFRLVSESSSSEVIAEKLEHHIIADDVEVEVLPRAFGVALVGMGAAALLTALGGEVPEAGAFVQSFGAWVFCGRRSVEPSFELVFDSEAAARGLIERLSGQGVRFVDFERMQSLRVAAGIPSVPREIGPEDMPGEGGLTQAAAGAVSFTKGCYLGQEVVARMHNVGRAQRGLFRLSGAGEVPSCPLALYNGGSKKVGELRTAFSQGEGWIGVALIKTRFAELGDVLDLEGRICEMKSSFSSL